MFEFYAAGEIETQHGIYHPRYSIEYVRYEMLLSGYFMLTIELPWYFRWDENAYVQLDESWHFTRAEHNYGYRWRWGCLPGGTFAGRKDIVEAAFGGKRSAGDSMSCDYPWLEDIESTIDTLYDDIRSDERVAEIEKSHQQKLDSIMKAQREVDGRVMDAKKMQHEALTTIKQVEIPVGSDMPNIPAKRFSRFQVEIANGKSGVYFLYQGSEVIYVGRSKNIGQRLSGHDNKPHDSFAFIEMCEFESNVAELFYIWRLRPSLNSQIQRAKKGEA